MHLDAEAVELYARRHLSETERLAVETHIADCLACKSKVYAAVEYSQALGQMKRDAVEMRDSHRVPTDDPATMQVLNPLSEVRWDVRIRNVSKGGMGVRAPKPVDRGSQVKVQRGALISFGEVRYCVPVGEGFHVGIRVLEVLSGSE